MGALAAKLTAATVGVQRDVVVLQRRLMTRVREELGLTYGVNVEQDSELRGGCFAIRTNIVPGNADKVIVAVDEVIAKLVATPASDAEIDEARVQLLAMVRERAFGTPAQRAAFLAELAASHQDPTHPEEVMARYTRVRNADMMRVARETLGNKPHVVMQVVTDSSAPREGRVAN